MSISLYAHSLGLGGSAVGDLLDAELVKLGLQLLELLGQLLLVLSPELTSLDLGRLDEYSISAGFTESGRSRTYHGGGFVVCAGLSALRIEDGSDDGRVKRERIKL